ncbi:MAG: GNAT family N-acetyltransferase [Pseudomonadota bacterium]
MQSLDVDSDLSLYPLDNSFAHALHGLVEKNRRYLRTWLPWLDANTSITDFEAFTEHTMETNQSGKSFVQAIVTNEKLCGVCGFNFIDQTNRWGEIGYWLSESHQGRGIISRSVAAQVEFGFAQLNLHRVSICAATENRRSRAIPERLGFKREGILRQSEWLYDRYVDQAVYARLSTD